jgi:hypothetical protein
MGLVVIEGGRRTGGVPIVQDVRREAARRIKAAGYDQAAVQAFMSGRAVPDWLKYFKLQVEFAGDALARLSPIPADFRSDRYWPAE